MLKVQQAKAFLSLKQRHVCQITFVKIQSFRIGVTLGRFSVDHKNPGYLGKFCKDNLVFILYSAYDTVLEQVAISLIILC
jgi:hypothetical protein